MGWVSSASSIGELVGSGLDCRHGGYEHGGAGKGAQLGCWYPLPENAESGMTETTQLIEFDRGEDEECDGGCGQWSLAVGWPENGREVWVSPQRVEELPVVSMARVRVDLKMLVVGRGVDLCCRPRQREVASARKSLERR